MTEKSTTTRMPTEWFKEDPNQPRKRFSTEEDRRLGEDMEASGQYRPIGALPDGTVIYGGRQLRAAKLVGMKTLETKIYQEPLTKLQRRVMQWTENELREPLSDPEKSDFCADLLRENPDMTQRQLAARLKVSEATITHLMAVFKVIVPIRDLYRSGGVRRNRVYDLSKKPEREQHAWVAERFSDQGKTEEPPRRPGRSRNGNVHAATVWRGRFQVGDAAVTLAAQGDAPSLNDFIRTLSELLTEAQAAASNDPGLSAKAWEKARRDKSKAVPNHE